MDKIENLNITNIEWSMIDHGDYKQNHIFYYFEIFATNFFYKGQACKAELSFHFDLFFNSELPKDIFDKWQPTLFRGSNILINGRHYITDTFKTKVPEAIIGIEILKYLGQEFLKFITPNYFFNLMMLIRKNLFINETYRLQKQIENRQMAIEEMNMYI